MSLSTSVAVFFLMLLARAGLVLLIGCAFAALVWCALRFASAAATAGRWASRWVRSGAGRWGILLVVGFGALALAEGKLKLPEDKPFPQGKHSPGVVTFKHRPHIKTSATDCTGCHPKLFKITEAGRPVDQEPITHKRMKKGEACGACHNGTDASALDECDTCHATEDN